MEIRSYSWIYTAAFVLAGISIALTGSVAAQSTGFVDVSADNLEGSGTADDPYLITSTSELQAMEDDLSANYSLTRNIDASGTASAHNSRGFDPISTRIEEFSGSLDGNNHTVTGLTINRSNESAIGLVGKTTINASVVDITLRDVSVNGLQNVGGLVGRNYGKVRNVTVVGQITGTTSVGSVVGSNFEAGHIEQAKATGNVIGTPSDELLGGDTTVSSSRIGGIAGGNSGDIQNSTAASNVSGAGQLGGITGSNSNGLVKNVTATGNVNGSEEAGGVGGSVRVGGLIGTNSGTIRGATTTGNVNGSFSVGGLIGINAGSISFAKATGNVTGEDAVGGLAGQNRKGIIENTFAVGAVSGSDSVGGLIGLQSLSGASTHNSYWDTEATGQSTSAGNTTGLTTDQMIGDAARNSMSEFEFGTVWEIQTDGYPRLLSPPVDTETDDGSQTDSTANVSLQNISITPDTVSNTARIHTLSFTAQNVSADGTGDEYDDEFEVTFPEEVVLEDHEVLNIDAQYSDVDQDGNTLNFSVSPRGGGITQVFVKMNVTLSSANNQ